MAKIHLDRLRKKYGKKIDTMSNQEIMNEIIEQNTANIQNKIARTSKANWSKALDKISTKEKRFVIPDVSEIIPGRAINVRKATIQGELIQDTLRDRLTKSLRTSLRDFQDKTDEPTFTTRRGRQAGRINRNLIGDFEKSVNNVFTDYTKRDKKVGMPKNVHTIAVTEVRSTINEMKDEYTKTILEKNEDVQAKKRWQQNRNLSKEPRKGHFQVDGKTIPYGKKFKVPRYKKKKGKDIRIGVTLMSVPHDPTAPADQVIGCNCDIDIIISKKKVKKR